MNNFCNLPFYNGTQTCWCPVTTMHYRTFQIVLFSLENWSNMDLLSRPIVSHPDYKVPFETNKGSMYQQCKAVRWHEERHSTKYLPSEKVPSLQFKVHFGFSKKIGGPSSQINEKKTKTKTWHQFTTFNTVLFIPLPPDCSSLHVSNLTVHKQCLSTWCLYLCHDCCSDIQTKLERI